MPETTGYKGDKKDPGIEALTTIGVHVSYAIEATKGERPTAKADYTELFGITSTPNLNVSPNTGDATPLSETSSVRKVALLKDYGDTLEFKMLSNDEYTDAWDEAAKAAQTGLADGKNCWFAIEHPKKKKVQFFKATPLEIDFGEMAVNSVWETSGFVTPNGGSTKAAWTTE